VNIDDILGIDVTPLSSISTSGPDMSVSMSVDRGTLMTVDFDDRTREMQDIATRSESDDTLGARRVRNPSLAPSCVLKLSAIAYVILGSG